jgi:hypothetical protein
MRKPNSAKFGTEIECPACEGTGFPAVVQPAEPGRRSILRPARNVLAKAGWLANLNDLPRALQRSCTSMRAARS